MKSILSFVFIINLLTFLGCGTSKTRVLPGGAKGGREVIVTAVTEEEAYNKAVDKARDYCGRWGKRAHILRHRKYFMGFNKSNQNSKRGNQNADIDSLWKPSHEYKVSMYFKCYRY